MHVIQMHLHYKYQILVRGDALKPSATTYAIELSREKSDQPQTAIPNELKKVIKPKLANHSILDKRCSLAVRSLFHQSFYKKPSCKADESRLIMKI